MWIIYILGSNDSEAAIIVRHGKPHPGNFTVPIIHTPCLDNLEHTNYLHRGNISMALALCSQQETNTAAMD